VGETLRAQQQQQQQQQQRESEAGEEVMDAAPLAVATMTGDMVVAEVVSEAATLRVSEAATLLVSEADTLLAVSEADTLLAVSEAVSEAATLQVATMAAAAVVAALGLLPLGDEPTEEQLRHPASVTAGAKMPLWRSA
jgi:Cu/Ag efflux pump CusA